MGKLSNLYYKDFSELAEKMSKEIVDYCKKFKNNTIYCIPDEFDTINCYIIDKDDDRLREETICAIKVDNNDDILIYSEYNEDAYEIEKSEIDWNSNNVHFLTGWSDVLNWYTLCNICESIESYEECNIKK